MKSTKTSKTRRSQDTNGNITLTEQGRLLQYSAVTWSVATHAESHIRIIFSMENIEVESAQNTFSHDYIVNCIVDDAGELNFPEFVKVILLKHVVTADEFTIFCETQDLARQGIQLGMLLFMLTWGILLARGHPGWLDRVLPGTNPND